MEPILIDVSLTGGRGPAKKLKSITEYCDKNNLNYRVVTDRKYVEKLKELKLKVDYIVDTDLNKKETEILCKFFDAIKKIDYSMLIKLGARVAGPMASRKLNKPYLILDGGLPDYMTKEESLYEAKTFQQANRYMITTQFEWNFPKRLDLCNAEVVCYPLSDADFDLVDSLREMSKIEILEKYKDRLQIEGGLFKQESSLLINLLMTDDYVSPNMERKTYGGWLTSKQYDQCVGFIRRLIMDLGEFCQTKVYVMMDKNISKVPIDLLKKYQNVKIITYKEWDFETEVAMQAASDAVISRATNYQPYLALLRKGNSVTTPVPGNGYMDEDTAAFQYVEKGLTRLIEYDDEYYINKLMGFIDDRKVQNEIKINQESNMNFILKRNANKVINELICQYY